MKTLYYGGSIITMAEPLYADAVLTEDSKIIAAGSRSELEKIAGECQKVDLNGTALLPGFIDPHSHFLQAATALLNVSLEGADTIDIIRSRIQNFISERRIQPGQWVHAGDYDSTIMKDQKNPTLEELDSFAPDNPLILVYKSGHMGFMNSQGLKLLGITENTPDPEGGRIEKIDGKLTGYLEENALINNLKAIPMPKIDEILSSVSAAQTKYASYGITTAQDGMVVKEMLPMYSAIAENNLLSIDLMLYSDPVTYITTHKTFGGNESKCNIKTGGIKIFLDGSPQGRTAWMREPYKDDENYCAYGTMKDEDVVAAFECAGRENAQLICHCNGDAAAEQFLRCLEIAEEKYPNLKELRPVIIHGQLMGEDQVKKAAELGAIVSFFVAHVYHWGDTHIKNFGIERADRISPAKDAIKYGVNYTFHQDAPVIEPNMMETVWCAVNRITKNGVHFSDNQKISTLDALKAITINGAYQYFQEDIKGSIEAGKAADFVILDRDPLKADPNDLKDIRILKTIKNGKCIFDSAETK